MIIPDILNSISDFAVSSVLMGGTGYLSGKAIKLISSSFDPYAGLLCGGAAAVSNLFFHKRANRSSLVVGITSFLFLPYKVCQHYGYEVHYVSALSIASVSFTVFRLIYGRVLSESELKVIKNF